MSDQEIVQFESKPSLQNPYVVCGLNGSFNSGNVSVGSIDHLISQFDAVKFAEIPASRYHVYQIPGIDSLRPTFKMEDGILIESYLPTNELYYATNTGSQQDLILLRGEEPSLNWEEYAETIVDLARSYGAERLYSICGLLDVSPYTREPLISCTCTDAKVKQEMENYYVTFSNRQGMGNFGQMLISTCQKKGLEGVNFTVRVPCYPEFNVFLSDSPKSVKAALLRLRDLMKFEMDFDELDSEIEDMEGKLDFVRQQNPKFNALIEEMEKQYVEMPYQESFDISPSEAVRLAEEFLKNNED